MNKIEQRVQRYKEDWQLLIDSTTPRTTDNILTKLDNLYNYLAMKNKMDEKFLADIVALSKTP